MNDSIDIRRYAFQSSYFNFTQFEQYITSKCSYKFYRNKSGRLSLPLYKNRSGIYNVPNTDTDRNVVIYDKHKDRKIEHNDESFFSFP